MVNYSVNSLLMLTHILLALHTHVPYMSMMENYFVNSLLIDWEQIGPRQKGSAAHSLMKGFPVEQDVFSIMNEIK